MSRPHLYTTRQISDAKVMRRKGYTYKAIAEYLGFSSVYTVKYHTKAGELKRVRANNKRWQDKNRERFLAKMRDYNKVYYKTHSRSGK